jgi:hypothetical protein
VRDSDRPTEVLATGPRKARAESNLLYNFLRELAATDGMTQKLPAFVIQAVPLPWSQHEKSILVAQPRHAASSLFGEHGAARHLMPIIREVSTQ